MVKPKLILIGAGGHARSCIDVIEQQGCFQIAGFVALPGGRIVNGLGYDIVGHDDDLFGLAKLYQYALIAVGQLDSSEQRIRLYQQAIQFGFRLPVIISPSAYVSPHATLGLGTIVMHGAIVNAGASIGNNCIINSRSLIEHDAQIADHCHISTGAILNGGSIVGVGSFIGSGAIVKQESSIGDGCLVGMGLSVRHNLADSIHFKGY
jgi:sugar O-acyltransferase (sialic acid O-acetyltransferase NeuD family)